MENIDLEKISVAVGDDVFLKYKDEIIYRATSMIDMLTRHKINVIGWDNLTPYQQKTIERCRLEIIAFLFDDIEILIQCLDLRITVCFKNSCLDPESLSGRERSSVFLIELV